ncbi:putative holin [Pseudomonas sp. C9-3]|uniref:putative holin n=1 Tax=Pseudomonas sp. C9-3 TaxID=3078264 RepID=UPI0028E31714|nr:putative holin [Pseudomonas sp. C9-3]
MPETSLGTTVGGVILGVGVSATMPAFDLQVLFGALLGAWLITGTQANLKPWLRVLSLLPPATLGYLFAEGALTRFPALTTPAFSAFACALLGIPLSLKAVKWLNELDFNEILRRIRQFLGGS